MDITIFPNKLQGQIAAIPSKSQAHRFFLCAALADRPTHIELPTICDDLAATIGCISCFGGQITHYFGEAEEIIPIKNIPQKVCCNCAESGATLRFLLPLAGALGIDTLFLLEGRLPYRPLSPLWEEMERHGCHLSWVSRRELEASHVPFSSKVTAGLHLTGKLKGGHYRLDGNISSQFVSGLLMALPLLDEESTLELIEPIESRPYIDMTLQVLQQFNVQWANFHTPGHQRFSSPGHLCVEGDWSNAAFWLAANCLGSNICVTGLNDHSLQGDKAIGSLLLQLSKYSEFSAANIPDLVPILAVVAAANQGALITDIHRLRMKESNRVASVAQMICDLGGKAIFGQNHLQIFPSCLTGGTVDAKNDHRIAMAAAIASTVCTQPVTILGAECVSKSFPGFWKEFTRLGGKI